MMMIGHGGNVPEGHDDDDDDDDGDDDDDNYKYLPWHHTDVKNGMVAFGEVGDHKEVFVLVS